MSTTINMFLTLKRISIMFNWQWALLTVGAFGYCIKNGGLLKPIVVFAVKENQLTFHHDNYLLSSAPLNLSVTGTINGGDGGAKNAIRWHGKSGMS